MICWQTIVLIGLIFLPRVAEAQQSGAAAGAASAPFRTWAVLVTPDLRKSSLEDQVLAGLSRDRTITLVDREHLDLVAKELSLGNLTESSGAGLRQRAGGIVKADALVLLSRETAAGKDVVKLIICECRCGARLRVDYIPLEESNVESAAKQILDSIEKTRRHFVRGIRQVFGVPPFVSRCLTHEYDHLQRGYSALLADALSLQPGVAVIEVEEARQIMREISLTDATDIERIVPMFVEGEYEIAQNGSESPRVDFRVKIRRGKTQERALPARNVKLSEAARYVGAELPALIAGLEKTVPEIALTSDQQAAALVARADAFARLGAWEHSTGLREAALLLRDDAAQRKKLIDEYCRIVQAPLPRGMTLSPPPEEYGLLCTGRWEKWHLAVAHLECLVRNQQGDGAWAVQMAQHLFRKEEATWNLRFAAEEELALAEQTRKRFLRECFLPFSQLKINGAPALHYWSTFYNGFAWRRLDRKPLGKEDLDYQLYMMENVIPEEVDNRRWFVFCASDFAGKEPGGFTNDEYAEFLNRLDRSQRPVNVFVGRMGRLYRNWSQGKGVNPSKEELLAEAESLLKELKSVPKFNARNSDWPYTLTELRNEIRRSLAPPAAVARAAPAAQPAIPPKITYEEIPLRVRGLAGGSTPLKGARWTIAPSVCAGPNYDGLGSLRLLNCGGRMDVLWHEGVVLFHRQKGQLGEILVEPEAGFSDAQWDGQNVWIAARSGSIRVLSSEGKTIARISREQGLIDCDQALRLLPIGPGKVCAVGSFGPNYRVWCAIVELKDGKAGVKVFHKATRVKTTEEERRSADADYVFVPRWLAHYPNPGGNPLILVARQTGWWEHMPPLAVDPATLAVTVPADVTDAEHGGDGFYFLDNCQVLQFSLESVSVREKPSPGVKTKSRELMHFDGTYGWQRAFLPWHGQIYVPGYPWCRIDPVTLKAERLTVARALLGNPPLGRWAVSAHYGMVLWGSWTDGFFHIRVADDDAIVPAPAGATAAYLRNSTCATKPSNTSPLPSILSGPW